MEKKDELSILMMIDKLKNIADYKELNREVSDTFLKEVTRESPEYLLKLIVQIIGMFLSKLNVPQDEVDIFTDQVKEQKMGELFKHFEGWDVQAIRKEVREEDIQKFVRLIKELSGIQDVARQKLMEEYQLDRESASEKVGLYW